MYFHLLHKAAYSRSTFDYFAYVQTRLKSLMMSVDISHCLIQLLFTACPDCTVDVCVCVCVQGLHRADAG